MNSALTFHIRTFQPSDREFVTTLAPRFSDFALPEWRTPNMVDQTNRRLLQQATDQPAPDSVIYIAEDNGGRQADFIYLETQLDFFTNAKHGYISYLAVDKACEGQDVGRLLLDQAEAWAREKGCELLTLYVFAGNQRARQLYDKTGFQQEFVKYTKALKPGS